MKANLTTLDSHDHEYGNVEPSAVRARDANDETRGFDSVASVYRGRVARPAANDRSQAQEYVTPDDFKDWSVPRT